MYLNSLDLTWLYEDEAIWDFCRINYFAKCVHSDPVESTATSPRSRTKSNKTHELVKMGGLLDSILRSRLIVEVDANNEFIEMVHMLPAFPALAALTVWLGPNHQAKRMLSALYAPVLIAVIFHIGLYGQDVDEDQISRTTILDEAFPWSGAESDIESMGSFLTRRFPCFDRSISMHFDARLRREMERDLMEWLAETGRRAEIHGDKAMLRSIAAQTGSKFPSTLRVNIPEMAEFDQHVTVVLQQLEDFVPGCTIAVLQTFWHRLPQWCGITLRRGLGIALPSARIQYALVGSGGRWHNRTGVRVFSRPIICERRLISDCGMLRRSGGRTKGGAVPGYRCERMRARASLWVSGDHWAVGREGVDGLEVRGIVFDTEVEGVERRRVSHSEPLKAMVNQEGLIPSARKEETRMSHFDALSTRFTTKRMQAGKLENGPLWLLYCRRNMVIHEEPTSLKAGAPREDLNGSIACQRGSEGVPYIGCDGKAWTMYESKGAPPGIMLLWRFANFIDIHCSEHRHVHIGNAEEALQNLGRERNEREDGEGRFGEGWSIEYGRMSIQRQKERRTRDMRQSERDVLGVGEESAKHIGLYTTRLLALVATCTSLYKSEKPTSRQEHKLCRIFDKSQKKKVFSVVKQDDKPTSKLSCY
ncbi:hypothetical protein K438DRAFT_2075256 [Mycena galopus ATCC 62051]|nr:hypothetical protein K438DRAFT_2075256 [Mycena galopus ATCC 62051]